MSSIPLEELIKTNLENYEARYDSNDWARMETVLGTTPDSRPFNWKPVLIVLIVLGLAGGGYVLFTTVDFSKILSKSTPVSTPPAVVKKAPVTPPVKTETPRPTPVINVDSIRQAEEAKAAAALAAKEEEERVQREEAEKEEVRLKKERRKEKEEPTKEEIELRRARRRALANADSGKTNNTSSTETTKETEKEKTKSTHIGLNIFSTMNADSLKKYQEKAKKDSTK